MAKPIIFSLDAMSYEEDNLIPFTYAGGLIKSSSIRISTASDNEVIYEGEQISGSTQFLLPANTIDVDTYGTQYYIQIRVTETDNTKSSWSDTRFAYFITTPTFQFVNLNDDTILDQSFIDAILLYYQLEDELLQNFIITLYDSSKTLLASSGIKYDVSNLKYTFTGLEDGIYYVRAKGETIHGYQVDTDFVKVTINYITPETYSTFTLTNETVKGQIRYETNIISIDYHGDETFEYEDGYINLIDKTLIYDRGYRVAKNCTFIIKGKDMYRSEVVFFSLFDEEKKFGFYVTSYIYDDDTIRYKLVANNGLDNYILYSPAIEALSESDLVAFWIRKKDNLYLFKVYVNGTEVE